MLCGWFLPVLLAVRFADPVDAPQPSEPVRADVAIRYVVRCDDAVERIHLTTLVPADVAAWQDVLSVEFDPKPSELFEKDGQRYARFELKNPPTESIVEVRARVAIGRPDLASRPTAKNASILPSEERKRTLRAERFLESDTAAIRAVAERIQGNSPVERARSALALTLECLAPAPYNSSDVGAKAALEARRGDCTEYADLLTALLRADGIPARRCYGFLLESANTPKHDWVEFHLDEAGWIALDPLHVERGAASFEATKPIYLRLSTTRNDDHLAGYHFFSWKNVGGKASVVDEFVVEPVAPERDEPSPGASAPRVAPEVREGG